ncbi:MAG: hypothetical protein ABUL64_01865 [Singulisphaera sp.]
MTEIWLHTNRRAIAFGLVFPIAGLLMGLAILALSRGLAPWVGWLGVVIAAVAAFFCLVLALQLRQPRIARRGDEVLLYLRSGPPFRVPLEFVEGFLMGQGASFLRKDQPGTSQVSTVVIRLADRATDFAQRDVKPALGSWCNHYVTIRGTWCEPLSLALVTKLNAQLAEAQAASKKAQAAS